jgi:hypothetical protein
MPLPHGFTSAPEGFPEALRHVGAAAARLFETHPGITPNDRAVILLMGAPVEAMAQHPTAPGARVPARYVSAAALGYGREPLMTAAEAGVEVFRDVAAWLIGASEASGYRCEIIVNGEPIGGGLAKIV